MTYATDAAKIAVQVWLCTTSAGLYDAYADADARNGRAENDVDGVAGRTVPTAADH